MDRHEHRELSVTIRTPAGINHDFRVNTEELVGTVVTTAVHYFTVRNELAAGAYGLALLRDGNATELNDSGRLEDYGIREGDVLVLLAKGPQVDGAC